MFFIKNNVNIINCKFNKIKRCPYGKAIKSGSGGEFCGRDAGSSAHVLYINCWTRQRFLLSRSYMYIYIKILIFNWEWKTLNIQTLVRRNTCVERTAAFLFELSVIEL